VIPLTTCIVEDDRHNPGETAELKVETTLSRPEGGTGRLSEDISCAYTAEISQSSIQRAMGLPLGSGDKTHSSCHTAAGWNLGEHAFSIRMPGGASLVAGKTTVECVHRNNSHNSTVTGNTDPLGLFKRYPSEGSWYWDPR
jgi:hypothetical protein